MRTFITTLFLSFCIFSFAHGGVNPPGDSVNAVKTVVAKKLAPTSVVGLRAPKAAVNTKESKYKRFTQLKYSGYIRPYMQYRHMNNQYANQPMAKDNITWEGVDYYQGGYTGYQEPMMLLRVEGNPTLRTHFKVEYALDNQMLGPVGAGTPQVITGNGLPNTPLGPAQLGNRRVQNYRIFQFVAGVNTKVGDFTLTSGGGVLWYKLSPFTLGGYQYRDDMFERYPWEPEGTAWSRYNSYYGAQNIPRDARWWNAPTQGYILEAKGMPLGFGASLVYGKVGNSTGFQSYLSNNPLSAVAGRVEKTISSHKIGVNYFNQHGAMDYTGKFKTIQQIITIDGKFNLSNVRIYTEAGMGRFMDSIATYTSTSEHMVAGKTYYQTSRSQAVENTILYNGAHINVGNLNWNHNAFKQNRCFNFEADFDKDGPIKIPLAIQAYSIGMGVVNNNSRILNTVNNHALNNPKNVGGAFDLTTYTASVTDINQLANNRNSLSLKHEDTYGRLKVIAAMSMQEEIQNMNDSISWWHQANAFTRSRFVYYQRYTGPYGRILSQYRRTYETIGITDGGAANQSYKKGYNALNLQLKYKLTIFKRELIISNYNSFNSVQRGWAIIPKFGEAAYLRSFYEELMLFYALHPKLTIVGNFCVERDLGNNKTELVDNNGNKILNTNQSLLGTAAYGQVISQAGGHPINQTDYGYGIGFDYDINSRAGFYVRQRFFTHSDKYWKLDKFSGSETSVELKIFF